MKKSLVVGYVLTALVALFLTFDTTLKMLRLAPAVEGTSALGYQADAVLWIGLIELVCSGCIWSRARRCWARSC